MIKVKFDSWNKNKYGGVGNTGTGSSPSGLPKEKKLETSSSSSSRDDVNTGGNTNCLSIESMVTQEQYKGGVAGIFGSGASSAFSQTVQTVTAGPGPHPNQTSQQCCLMEDGIRCNRIAGNASYSKRIQKTVQQRRLHLNIDPSASSTYICETHKNMIQSIRTSGKRKRKDSGDGIEENGNSNDGFGSYSDNCETPHIDLCQLQVNTLRRYKRHYRIQTRPGINKSQLAENLMRHFKTIPVLEKEAITYFIYMVKCNKNKLDVNKGLGSGGGSLDMT